MTTAATSTGGLGQTLRAARERAGLTRAQLAALAGCSFSQLSNIEQGAVPNTSRVLEDALRAIDAYMSEAARAGGSAAATEGTCRSAATPSRAS